VISLLLVAKASGCLSCERPSGHVNLHDLHVWNDDQIGSVTWTSLNPFVLGNFRKWLAAARIDEQGYSLVVNRTDAIDRELITGSCLDEDANSILKHFAVFRHQAPEVVGVEHGAIVRSGLPRWSTQAEVRS
jgi:hypothetical protein